MSVADESPRTGASEGFPTRDELTEAWGDRVLEGLRPGLRAYFAPGRFVAGEGEVAVFALPDGGLLSRAESLRAEAEAALAKDFSRPIPLRLILDDAPVRGRPETPERSDDPADYDFETLDDAPPAVVSPEQRLLQAFPGAEEVAP